MKEKLENIILLLDEVISESNINKIDFYCDNKLKSSVQHKLRTIGNLGQSISNKIKKDYEKDFMWSLFFILKDWIIDNDDDTWYLIKGHTFKGVKYESLEDNRDFLKKIYIAEFVLRIKDNPAPDINKITKDEIINKYPKKIIYTPMGIKS